MFRVSPWQASKVARFPYKALVSIGIDVVLINTK